MIVGNIKKVGNSIDSCCDCCKQRDRLADFSLCVKETRSGSKNKFPAWFYSDVPFQWIQANPAADIKFLLRICRILLHYLCSLQFLCAWLLLSHFPMNVTAQQFCNQQYDAYSVEMEDLHERRNDFVSVPNETLFGFCEQYKFFISNILCGSSYFSSADVKLKNASKSQSIPFSATYHYHNESVTFNQTSDKFEFLSNSFHYCFDLFCDHIPLVALLNIRYDESFSNQSSCQTKLRELLITDSDAHSKYLEFKRIMHHYATYDDFSFQSTTSICLVSYFSPIS